MSWKLADALPKPKARISSPKGEWPEPDRLIGLELEYENVLNSQALLEKLHYKDYWATHADGSLQNHGLEFILSSPVPISHAPILLEEFLAAAIKAKFDPHWRAGTHVHVQVTDMNSQQLSRLLLIYALVEPAICAWVGDQRFATRFCRPWHQASSHLHNLVQALEAESAAEANLIPVPLEQKYSALNTHSLWRLGTLEFRHLEATLDSKRLEDWLRIIASILSAATNKNLKLNELVSEARQTPPKAFYTGTIGATAAELLPDVDLSPGIFTAMTFRQLVEKHVTKDQSADMSWEELMEGPKSPYVDLFVKRHSRRKRKTKVKKAR